MTRQTVDPITLTVVWNGVKSISEDISLQLQRTAYSEIVRAAGDCSAAVFDAQGRNLAQGEFNPGMVGGMTRMVEHMLQVIPRAELEPGDAILTNDIYFGAGHLPDAFTISPVFLAGDIIGFVGSSAHLMDVGGAAPGGQAVEGILDNYQEGLRIPPVCHYKRGEPVSSVTRLIAENVRFPEMVLGDLRAKVGANNFGARRLQEFFVRYGQETMEACFDRIIEESEARTRRAFDRIPDGRYFSELWLDDYGPGTDAVRLAVTVIVEGSDVTLDWTGTDSQVPAGMNPSQNYSFAYACFAIKAMFAPDIPWNLGCLRPLSFVAPEGCFVNPRPPAPGGGRAAAAQRISEVVMRALADVAPKRAIGASSQICATIMSGYDLDDEPYLLWDIVMGGIAGRSIRDGTEGFNAVVNPRNMPVEVSEMTAPVRIERLEFVCDTSGAGTFRGASAVRKDIRFLGTHNRLSPLADRTVFAPHGLFGGHSGACGKIELHPHADSRWLHPKAGHEVNQGDVVRFQTSGAGGYGEPLLRAPEAVLEDVLEGYISREVALGEYRVVITLDGIVDPDATRTARLAGETVKSDDGDYERERGGL